MEKEVRTLNIPVKVEKREDGTVKSICGYPIVYNKDSEYMGFIERVAPGAAKKALKRSDIRGLKNHDPNLIFARQGVNLNIREENDGVYYEATPINTRNFREIAEEVDSGLLTGQSFGFTILADEWKDLDTDCPKRTITEIGEIYDVGPVTYPAYQDTSVALRSLEKAKSETPSSPEVPNQITITDNDAIFAFDNFEQFERIAQKVKELRDAQQPTLPDPTAQKKEGQEEPTLNLEPLNFEEMEQRLSNADKKVKLMEVQKI